MDVLFVEISNVGGFKVDEALCYLAFLAAGVHFYLKKGTYGVVFFFFKIFLIFFKD